MIKILLDFTLKGEILIVADIKNFVSSSLGTINTLDNLLNKYNSLSILVMGKFDDQTWYSFNMDKIEDEKINALITKTNLRKSITTVYSNLGNKVGICSPIQESSGNIIGYFCCFFNTEDILLDYEITLSEVISKFIYEYVKNAYIKHKITILKNNKNFIHFCKLTDKEKKILKMLANGNSDKYISNKLFISMSTVRKHINSIFSKLCAKNRTHAAIKYVEYDILKSLESKFFVKK